MYKLIYWQLPDYIQITKPLCGMKNILMIRILFFSLQHDVAVMLTSVLLSILLTVCCSLYVLLLSKCVISRDFITKQLPTEQNEYIYILYIPYNLLELEVFFYPFFFFFPPISFLIFYSSCWHNYYTYLTQYYIKLFRKNGI